MIAQPNPQLEARPAAPDVQHKLPLHLPGRPHLRPASQGTRAIDTHIPNIALAGLQILIGYLIELSETLAGVGLMAAGLVALLRPLPGATSAVRARRCSCSVTSSSRDWLLLLLLARDCSV